MPRSAIYGVVVGKENICCDVPGPMINLFLALKYTVTKAKERENSGVCACACMCVALCI
jgi:hypothetical protein